MEEEKPSFESQATLEKSQEKARGRKAKEFGGFESEGLPEPTRYGDWDVRGRCSDF